MILRFKIFLLLSLLLSLPSTLLAQGQFKENQYFYVRFEIKPFGGFNEIREDQGGSPTLFSIEKGSKIRIESATAAKVVFKVTKSKKPKQTKVGETYVKEGELYNLDPSKIKSYLFRRLAGFSGEIAITPFKYRPDQEKIYPGGNLAFSGSFFYNLGGFTVKPMAFAGLTTISLADVNSETTDTDTKAGFTVGGGLTFIVLDVFEFGITLGLDFVDEDWESNKKVWYGLTFGVPLGK